MKIQQPPSLASKLLLGLPRSALTFEEANYGVVMVFIIKVRKFTRHNIFSFFFLILIL